MNACEYDILIILKQKGYSNQRSLADDSSYSVGAVNNALKNLQADGLIDKDFNLTDKAYGEFSATAPKNAVILAAGYGMRMVPINAESPKALLEVRGEPLIERQIKQLQKAGVKKIQVVVGFMKEQFDYLIDEYGVELVVNTEYSSKNNLHSLWLVTESINNTYIVPCDIWCEKNPFSPDELYSWYMLSDQKKPSSRVRINRKGEIAPAEQDGNKMIGIAYLCGDEAVRVKENLKKLEKDVAYNDAFWEEALFGADITIKARAVKGVEVIEINTYEQLRELDGESKQLHSKTINIAASVLSVEPSQIKNIEVLKKGMTNRSFIFECKGERYIMRIPGEGTDMLINRREEASVYGVLKDKDICEDILYIDAKSGYKVTRFFENARVCDAENKSDLAKCMAFLREFHQKRLTVDHTFDLFGKIDFYESLWDGKPSAYRDYKKTKEKVFSLREYIEKTKKPFCLTHIDAVPDNFLLYKDANGKESIRLIDWEYSAMQDPHLDIAMFSIYAMYNREQIDTLIDIYFTEGCEPAVRKKIYAYVSVCGLLWSNWCEYKRQLGVEFGEYSLAQYRYAKDFYKIASEIL